MIGRIKLCVFLLPLLSLCVNGQKKPKQEQESIEVKVNYGLPKDVVVIGAGIAGLAAARRIKADRTNFTVKVYEARKDRFGGRVWTDKLTNHKAKGPEVDLGGAALNFGVKSNPLVELAEELDLKMHTLDNLQLIVPWQKKEYSGNELAGITRKAAQILGQAINESLVEKVERSVKDAIDIVIQKGNIADSDSLPAHMVRCFPSYILEDYSTFNYHAADLDVGYDRILLDGMGELVDRLLSGSTEEPPLNLILNKAARQIKVDKERRQVAVRFLDGSQIWTDVVVIAVPVSVIASGDLLFEPNLPKKYQLAAKEISMSDGNSVIVEFERAFWPDEFGVFLRAVKTDAERGSLQAWININRIIHQPALKSALFGKQALEFEKLTDEEAEKRVLNALNEMFGEEVVKQGGKVVRLQRSKWTTDKWSQGASSYPKVGSQSSMWDTFAEPLCPYIYFAGEHTIFDGHGTLHGAYNSGIRAGDQLLGNLCEIRRIEEEKRKEEARRKKKEKNKTKEDIKEEDDNVEYGAEVALEEDYVELSNMEDHDSKKDEL